MKSGAQRGNQGPPSGMTTVRLQRASGFVVGLFLVLGLAGIFERLAQPSVSGEAVAFALEGRQGAGGEVNLFGVSDATVRPRLPARFEDEVVRCVEYKEVRVDEPGGVVGFSVAGLAQVVFDNLAGELGRNGWTSIESGLATSGSFTKSKGRYSWVFVTCVQVGDTVSVVMQYAGTGEGS